LPAPKLNVKTRNMIEHLVLQTLKMAANKATPSEINRMLNRVEGVLAILESSKTYREVEKFIETRKDSLFPRLKRSLALFGSPEHAVVWITGLRNAVNDEEVDRIDRMLFQICLYVLAQKNNIYRIEDDRLRLMITFTHIRIAAELLKEHENQ
jgi:hypothetical protein